MEAAQLLVAVTVPVLVLMFGWLANRSLKRLETRQAANQNLIEKRIQVYDQMAEDMNSIFCFFLRVGHYKDITPDGMIEIKRRVDRRAHTQRPFFDPAHQQRYLEFMDACFSTHTGVAQHAKIRADPARYRAEFARLLTPWNDAWDQMFVSDLSADRGATDLETADEVTRRTVNESYEALMDSFSKEMGIPAPPDEEHWWRRRRSGEQTAHRPTGIAGHGPQADPSPTPAGDESLPLEISLDGASNFRDMGGYATTRGTVRFSEVYRSGRLPKLTDDDLSVLEALGIRTVVTLLTADDVDEYGPDRLPTGARLVELPIDSPTATELANGARTALSTGDFSAIPPAMNLRIHRLLVVDGRAQYGDLLRLIADSENRPLVFHCSHGVHRTGTAAAILLALLGVDWATIRDDYLASNIAREREVTAQLARMQEAVAHARGVPAGEIDMTNMEAFMIQDGSYIDASRDQVQIDYRSFDDYARSGLGCPDDLIDSLRDQLIDPEGRSAPTSPP